MIFTTWAYGLFLAIAVGAFWMLPARLRGYWLIGAGLVFYAQWYPPHLWLILAMTVAVYGVARAAAASSATGRRRLGTAGAVGALGVLVYYKYAGWIAASLGLARFAPGPVPLAISFFVFEFVHYAIEIRRGTIAPGRPRDFLLFILFFPTLVCGPIKRFDGFSAQLDRLARPSHDEVAAALERIVVGLAKKLLVADPVGRIVDLVWAAPLAWPRATLWCAMYGFAVQILFDFSGYSDIAIGSARLFGIRVPENFLYPYFQTNLIGFWRSWHVSLTSWIRDYVYLPLGGNRRGAWRTHVNRLVAMGLCGLWHGAAGHFVWWGLYHGVGLDVCHAWRRRRGGVPRFGIAGRALAVAATFHYVCVGWLLFRLDAGSAVAVLARMVGWS